MKLVTRLGDLLRVNLCTADEIWIAVALMSGDGLEYIIESLKINCKQNYLIGLDLPTDPKALMKLNELQLKSDLKVHLFTEKECFHPKLYLIKKGNDYSAFFGSANCTRGGLFNNVELTAHTTDRTICGQLIEWFEKYYKIGKPLTTDFIEQYQADYTERKDRKNNEERIAIKEKQILNKEYQATAEHKSILIKALKKYRKGNEYLKIVAARRKTVKELRKDLDYPNYKNINISSYFSHWELGHLIAIAIPAIKRQIPKLRVLLKYLSDESIDISVRYDRALNGDLKVEGVSKAFISKVLVAHKPDLYFVKNGKIEKTLRKYGIKLPRGLSEGEKYKITSKYLRQICLETGIKDLSVLDHFLYLEADES